MQCIPAELQIAAALENGSYRPQQASVQNRLEWVQVHLHHKVLKMHKLRQSLWVSNSGKAPPGYRASQEEG